MIKLFTLWNFPKWAFTVTPWVTNTHSVTIQTTTALNKGDLRSDFEVAAIMVLHIGNPGTRHPTCCYNGCSDLKSHYHYLQPFLLVSRKENQGGSQQEVASSSGFFFPPKELPDGMRISYSVAPTHTLACLSGMQFQCLFLRHGHMRSSEPTWSLLNDGHGDCQDGCH